MKASLKYGLPFIKHVIRTKCSLIFNNTKLAKYIALFIHRNLKFILALNHTDI